MVIKVLGTQSPYSTPGHNCPGFLITYGEKKILLDCGSGTHSLLNLPFDLNNLSIILSHLHRDHYNDIYNLQYASFVFHNQNRLNKPIDIYMPKTPVDISNDIISENNSFSKYQYIDNETKLIIGSMHISFLKTDHNIETYAIKITCNNKIIVYSSDTSFSAKERLIKFSKNADLLICESSLLTSYSFDEINPHLTSKQSAIIAKEANVKNLMLTHFWPEEDINNYVKESKQIFENVLPAIEGQILII